MTGKAKTLYLLRHAKSAWDSDAPDDFSRPLNPRGRRDALNMGQWMWHQHLLPEQIISSPALRAWQTVTTICYSLQINPAIIDFNKHLYLADVDVLLNAIASTNESVNSLLMVGHNPGLEQLIHYLLNNDLPDNSGDKFLHTATLCTLRLSRGYELEKGSAQLIEIKRPKTLA